MSEQRNLITQAIARALGFVMTQHPLRTSLGVILGCALAFLTVIFEPALSKLAFLKLTDAPLIGWIAVGILVMHFPTLLFLVRRKPIGTEAIDQVIEVIERSNFSDTEKRSQYRALVSRMSQRIALSKKTKGEVRAVENSIASDDGSTT